MSRQRRLMISGCMRGAEELHVEVKGTTGVSATAVILTRDEVIAARSAPEAAVLALVHGITRPAAAASFSTPPPATPRSLPATTCWDLG